MSAGRVALVSLFALTACGSGLDVKTDYDPGAVQAMQGYRTWAYAQVKSEQDLPAITKRRIETAIDAAMQAKGLRKVQSGADFYVAYLGTTSQQTDYHTTSNYYGYGWGGWYGPAMGGMTSSTTTAINWTQGTLVIDIVDAGRNEMVFRTIGQAEIHENVDPEERQQNLNYAVTEMLATFPPSPGS